MHAGPAPIASLRDRLDLTADSHWGRLLRRGLVPLSDGDLALIHEAMTGERLPVSMAPRPVTATQW